MNFLSSKVRPNEEDEESKVEDSAIGKRKYCSYNLILADFWG